jgi:hypothetical protein
VYTFGFEGVDPLKFLTKSESLENPGGYGCFQQTGAMNEIESALNSHMPGEARCFYDWFRLLVWHYLSWTLHDLPGPVRAYLLASAHAIEHDVTLTWNMCAPAVILSRLFLAERWTARAWQCIFWSDLKTAMKNQEAGLYVYRPWNALLKQAGNLLEWYHNHKQRIEFVAEGFGQVLDLGEQRLRDRLFYIGRADDLDNEMTYQFFCSASVGVGAMHVYAINPTPASNWAAAASSFVPSASNAAHTDLEHGPKVAFIFLAYDRLFHDSMWVNFFANADPDMFTLLIHVTRSPWRGALDKALRPYVIENLRPSAWCGVAKLQVALLQRALEDARVVKAVFLSQDAVPVKAFGAIYADALRSPGRSSFCVDHEWARAETWSVFSREHAELFVSHEEALWATFTGVGVCDTEEVFYQSLLIANRAHEVDDVCVMFAHWAEQKGFAPRLNTFAPTMIHNLTQTWTHKGACSNPFTFQDIHEDGLWELIGHPDAWFFRKAHPIAVVTTSTGTQSLGTWITRNLGLRPSLHTTIAAVQPSDDEATDARPPLVGHFTVSAASWFDTFGEDTNNQPPVIQPPALPDSDGAGQLISGAATCAANCAAGCAANCTSATAVASCAASCATSCAASCSSGSQEYALYLPEAQPDGQTPEKRDELPEPQLAVQLEPAVNHLAEPAAQQAVKAVVQPAVQPPVPPTGQPVLLPTEQPLLQPPVQPVAESVGQAAERQAGQLGSESLPPCVDTNEYCSEWAQTGECTSNPTYMDAVCALSCRRCS